MDRTVMIILPEVDRGYLSNELYHLSELLANKNPENQSHGFLGGEYGYGQDFKNKVFEMFPFYWGDCYEDEHDKYCPAKNLEGECSATRPNFYYYELDFSVDWYKYIGRGMEVNKKLKRVEMREMFRKCEESIA